MAQTTFTGPVTSLNGFIGGPNVNAKGSSATDTQQGGNLPFLASGTSVSCYVFSDGAQWLQLNDPTSTVA